MTDLLPAAASVDLRGIMRMLWIVSQPKISLRNDMRPAVATISQILSRVRRRKNTHHHTAR